MDMGFVANGFGVRSARVTRNRCVWGWGSRVGKSRVNSNRMGAVMVRLFSLLSTLCCGDLVWMVV